MYASEVCLSYSSVEEHPADRARRRGVFVCDRSASSLSFTSPLVSHMTRAEGFFTHLMIWSGSLQKHSFRTLIILKITKTNKPGLFLDAVENITRCRHSCLIGVSEHHLPLTSEQSDLCLHSSKFHAFSAFPCSFMKWQEDPWNRLNFSVWGCGGAKRYVLLAPGFPCWHMEGQVGP